MPGKTDKQIMYKINSIHKNGLKQNLKVSKNDKKSMTFNSDESMEYSMNDKFENAERIPSGEQYKLMMSNVRPGSHGNSDHSNYASESLFSNINDLNIIAEEPE